MFPVTRELLLYVLVFLVFVMVILVALIFKKRQGPGKPPGEKAKAAPAPKAEEAAPSETGAADAQSIKERLKSEKVEPKEAPPAPKPTPPPVPTPTAGPERHEPADTEPVFEEGVIEQGLELEEAAGIARPPEEVKRPAPEEKLDFVDLKGYEEYRKGEAEEAPEEKPPEPEAVPEPAVKSIKALEPRKRDEAEFSYKRVEGLKGGQPIDSETLSKSSKEFVGQTISIEGHLHLSSKGPDDVWYSLFDRHGSVVVRSMKEIPHERCRLYATVKQTRLGQIYLEVLRSEKI